MAGIIGTSRLEMWVQDGQIFIKTPEVEKPVTPNTLLDEIQKCLFIDFGVRPLKQVRNAEFNGNTTICPYCHSTDTIRYGSRTTLTEYQRRRWCNSCNHIFIAGKEPVQEKTDKDKKGTEVKVPFLHLLGFNTQEIAERLNIGWSVVNTSLKVGELGSISSDFVELKTAPEFPIHEIFKETLGKTHIWDYDGRIAIRNKKISSDTIIFLFKSDVKTMLSLSKTKVQEGLKKLPAAESEIILNYIEDKKDDMMGILPKTHIFTRVAEDSGELNAELMESAAHKNETDDSDASQ